MQTSGQTPEEEELAVKRAELSHLESRLVDREVGLMSLQADLAEFERRYLKSVAPLFAALDALRARAADSTAARQPGDSKARETATRARELAASSSHAAGQISDDTSVGLPSKQNDEAKRAYRKLARHIHPDLASDDIDRARRTQLMAQANAAYANGDTRQLQRLLDERIHSPAGVSGDDLASQLVRVIRQIAQARRRLSVIDEEIKLIQSSDLFALYRAAKGAAEKGTDLLAQMARGLEVQIASYRT